MLKIGKKLNNYRSAKGIHFVYEVTGSESELNEYNEDREARGWNKGIFNSLNPIEIGTEIRVKYDGDGFFAATDLESEILSPMQKAIVAQVAKAMSASFGSFTSKQKNFIKEEFNQFPVV